MVYLKLNRQQKPWEITQHAELTLIPFSLLNFGHSECGSGLANIIYGHENT